MSSRKPRALGLGWGRKNRHLKTPPPFVLAEVQRIAGPAQTKLGRLYRKIIPFRTARITIREFDSCDTNLWMGAGDETDRWLFQRPCISEVKLDANARSENPPFPYLSYFYDPSENFAVIETWFWRNYGRGGYFSVENGKAFMDLRRTWDS